MRILEMTLTALNVEELRPFYVGLLGLREVEPLGPGRMVIQAGATRITFLEGAAELAQANHPRYHFAFDVPASRFEAALIWLKQRGGLIASPEGQTRFHSDNWNADSVYFRDPQGNILELIARHTRPAQEVDDPLRAGRSFDGGEILSVTEIGLAVGSVPDAAAALTRRMPGLAAYGEGSDTFTPVGDVNGLLIVVINSRIWFPNTGVPALPLPLDLLLEMQPGFRYRLTAPPYPFSIAPM